MWEMQTHLGLDSVEKMVHLTERLKEQMKASKIYLEANWEMLMGWLKV